MKRIWWATALVGFTGLLLLPATEGLAQNATSPAQSAKPSLAVAREAFAQSRNRRPSTRLLVYPQSVPGGDGVYPHYYPGPNAVRDCSATYVKEVRPSGTFIVPRVNCYWRPG